MKLTKVLLLKISSRFSVPPEYQRKHDNFPETLSNFHSHRDSESELETNIYKKGEGEGEGEEGDGGN